MQDRHVDVETPAGRMETFVTHPDAGGPFPAVFFYMNVGGLSDNLRDFARRIGTMGYYCAVPDLYHRVGKVRFDPDSQDPEILELRKRTRASLTNQMVMDDTRALLKFLDAQEEVKPGPKGVVI